MQNATGEGGKKTAAATAAQAEWLTYPLMAGFFYSAWLWVRLHPQGQLLSVQYGGG